MSGKCVGGHFSICINFYLVSEFNKKKAISNFHSANKIGLIIDFVAVVCGQSLDKMKQ